MRVAFIHSFHFIFIYLGTVAPSVHENCFSGGSAQIFAAYDLILLLKMARDGACLTSSSRLFQSLGPRKDIAVCPLLVFRKVASCELRVASCELRVASCELRVAS